MPAPRIATLATSLLWACLVAAGGCSTLRPEGAVVPVDAPAPRESGKVKVGEAYFDFDSPQLDGQRFVLSGHVGQKVILLQFWGIRCGPCLQEFALLDRLYRRYREQGLLVVGVNTDGLDAERLSSQMASRAVQPSYPVVLDPDFEAAQHYTHWLVPVSVLIDRHGVVRAVHTGYKPELDAAIEAEVLAALENG